MVTILIWAPLVKLFPLICIVGDYFGKFHRLDQFGSAYKREQINYIKICLYSKICTVLDAASPSKKIALIDNDRSRTSRLY